MYQQFYGLRELPFELTPDPRFLFFTPSHREALSNLQYGLTSAKPVTVLIGEAGTGKTTLSARGARIGAVPQRALRLLEQPGTLTRAEFVEMLAERFELGPRCRALEGGAAAASSRRSCFERRARGEITALVVDEAQSLSRGTARGDQAAREHRDHDDEAAAPRPGRAARARGAAERSLAAAVEAADCVALHDQDLRAAGDGRLYRVASPGGGRRSGAPVHARCGRRDSRAQSRHPAHDQRAVRQRAAERACARPTARRQGHRRRRVQRLRSGWNRAGDVHLSRCRPCIRRRDSSGGSDSPDVVEAGPETPRGLFARAFQRR